MVLPWVVDCRIKIGLGLKLLIKQGQDANRGFSPFLELLIGWNIDINLRIDGSVGMRSVKFGRVVRFLIKHVESWEQSVNLVYGFIGLLNGNNRAEFLSIFVYYCVSQFEDENTTDYNHQA